MYTNQADHLFQKMTQATPIPDALKDFVNFTNTAESIKTLMLILQDDFSAYDNFLIQFVAAYGDEETLQNVLRDTRVSPQVNNNFPAILAACRNWPMLRLLIEKDDDMFDQQYWFFKDVTLNLTRKDDLLKKTRENLRRYCLLELAMRYLTEEELLTRFMELWGYPAPLEIAERLRELVNTLGPYEKNGLFKYVHDAIFKAPGQISREMEANREIYRTRSKKYIQAFFPTLEKFCIFSIYAKHHHLPKDITGIILQLYLESQPLIRLWTSPEDLNAMTERENRQILEQCKEQLQQAERSRKKSIPAQTLDSGDPYSKIEPNTAEGFYLFARHNALELMERSWKTSRLAQSLYYYHRLLTLEPEHALAIFDLIRLLQDKEAKEVKKILHENLSSQKEKSCLNTRTILEAKLQPSPSSWSINRLWSKEPETKAQRYFRLFPQILPFVQSAIDLDKPKNAEDLVIAMFQAYELSMIWFDKETEHHKRTVQLIADLHGLDNLQAIRGYLLGFLDREGEHIKHEGKLHTLLELIQSPLMDSFVNLALEQGVSPQVRDDSYIPGYNSNMGF